MTREKSNKKYQRASFRFDYDTFNEFRDICKEEGYKQAPLLEKLMKDFIKATKKENSNDK